MNDSYLEYPGRGYGQDHDFYDWRMVQKRPKLKWDGDTKVAVCLIVPLEFFPLNPSGSPFKHPGAMKTPYPDLRHFTVRDYGNRVGVFRILEALEAHNISATFAVDGEVARRYPCLVNRIGTAEHCIAVHGLSTDKIHHSGLTGDMEVAWIIEAEQSFGSEDYPSGFNDNPSGWMSPARNQSPRTLELLAARGYRYCLDWEMDQVPVTAQTGAGNITLIPNSYELSDFTLLHIRGQSGDSWLAQIGASIDLLLEEYARYGSQMLGLTLTPYVIGQPFRIRALRMLLDHIRDTDGVEVLTADAIDKQFREQA
ncbi:MAG: polysaccharide deacetylase family protein [Hyphomonadaceae bacterium]|nr:polysaccharide deacetylase family protein [Hyphomonadaceae bacterium]MBC6413165.1 polysaccharide deacetylase family protein [Hyphomonadaceae bacterium]